MCTGHVAWGKARRGEKKEEELYISGFDLFPIPSESLEWSEVNTPGTRPKPRYLSKWETVMSVKCVHRDRLMWVYSFG